MNPYLKTLVLGLAALGLVILATGVTALVMLRQHGALTPRTLRALVLTPQERALLDTGGTHPAAPAPVRTVTASEDELLAQLAELASASRANQLVTRLKRQQETLDERQAWLDQQWADLQLAKAGVERMQRQLQEQDLRLKEAISQQEQERARWATAQAAEAGHLQVLGEVEKTRYRDQARLFELMKENAWPSLRRFPPREIARYLALMDARKAARVLVQAQQDAEHPELAPAIHQEMLGLDLEGVSGSQVERLATLYAFMSAEQVLPFLKGTPPRAVADVLAAMQQAGRAKQSAALLEALRQEDSARELEVRRLLEQTPLVQAPAAQAAKP